VLHNVLLGATISHATPRLQLIRAVELRLGTVGLRFEFPIRNTQYIRTTLAPQWCLSYIMSPAADLWNNAT